MGILRQLAVVIIGIGIVVGGGFYTGLLPPSDIQEPTVTVEDIGDWGEVSNSQIEMIHTLNVQNPNNFSVNVTDMVTMGVDLKLNEVPLGSVEKTGVDIEQGNNTVKLASEINQNQIGEFWANFINQGETINADVSGELEIDKGPGVSVSTPSVETSALTEETPVSDAMNNAVDEAEGEYSFEINTEGIDNEYLSEAEIEAARSDTTTAEFTVDNADFRWGEVDAEQTEVEIDLTITNTGEIALPAPDGSQVNILLNDIEVFNAKRSEDISFRRPAGDSLLLPSETKTYTLIATAENQNIERWFTTYAEQREKSDVRGEIVFAFQLGDTTITAPKDGVIAYECQFQTGIFVDNQSQSTTCGNDGTAYVGTGRVQQEVENPTSNSPPTANIDLNQSSGQAPLSVEFDGSGSSDPDGDIREYIWTIEGIDTNLDRVKRGETVTHRFNTTGEYEVTLTVVDSAFNRVNETATVNVDSRLSDSSSDDSEQNNQEPEQVPPEAVAEAQPTSGEAPLEVTFDASGSSDDNGNIEEYIWRFKDGSSPGSGETTTHEFNTAGQFDVELVVIDSENNRDTDTVTIDVSSRVG